MIAYHSDANLKLAEPSDSRKDAHILLAYNKIMQRLTDNQLSANLQILDNEASVNVTIKSASHSRPTPIKVCLNPGMICPVTAKS